MSETNYSNPDVIIAALRIESEARMAALLTAEAERDELKHAEKQVSDAYLRVRSLVGAWNTNRGGEDRFEVTENCVKDIIKKRDQLRAELAQREVGYKATQEEYTKSRADLTQLRRNVATLYEWIQGNTSLTGKQKEAANYIFDQLDKGVREDSDLRADLEATGRVVLARDATMEKLCAELATAKTELAYANDAATKGKAGRNLGTALEEALKENAELKQEEIRRIKYLNKLATWAQQDPTGPIAAEGIRAWVLEQIKGAFGQTPEPTCFVPQTELYERLQEENAALREFYQAASTGLFFRHNCFAGQRNCRYCKAVEVIKTLDERKD